MIASRFPDFLGAPHQEKSALEKLAEQRETAENDPDAIAKLAKVIRSDAFPMYMFGALGNTPLAATPLESYRLFVDNYVRDVCGDDCTSNPLLRMLVEQSLLAHHTIARLHYEAAGVLDSETRRVNHGLATTLTGELRRLVGQVMPLIKEHRSNSDAGAGSSTAKQKKGAPGVKLVSKECA